MSDNKDIFGKLLMEKLRDVSIELCEGLTESKYDSPGHREIQKQLESFTTEQKEVFKNCVTYCIDGGINDFLYNIDKESRKSKDLILSIKGKNITESSSQLSHEVHGENGWKKQFSKY
jgi:hypothetical protein